MSHNVGSVRQRPRSPVVQLSRRLGSRVVGRAQYSNAKDQTRPRLGAKFSNGDEPTKGTARRQPLATIEKEGCL